MEGPVRTVKLSRTPDLETIRDRALWQYPWPVSSLYSHNKAAESDMTPCMWFFPDSTSFDDLDGENVYCLTVAKWRREWDDRWYTAGLVLTEHCCIGLSVNGGETQRPWVRVGYFEHSWSERHAHWEDHGEKQIVLLV
ncbi:hypothetical protein HJFPF1_08250 [Paramyrothecium foliicola]|nr:hypothetical protein HJFPF1_08250 [Paramyrothecium foliicola]